MHLATVVLMGVAFRKASLNAGLNVQKTVIGYGAIVAVWTAYTCLLSATGILQNFTMPPRIPLFLIVPALVFMIFFFTSRAFRPLIAGFPAAFAVYYQSFRIFVELLIFCTFARGIFPVEPTFEGYNFDIVMGLSAPVIGWLAFQKKSLSPKVLLAWNILGLVFLAIVVSIFLGMLANPGAWGYEAPPIGQEFGTVPFLFLPAFLMPSAVFMHLMSLVKIKSA